MYRSKSSLDLLLEEIKNVISNRFSDFFQEKDDMEKILLNLPIYKRLINENQNLIEKIKDLELELIEKRTENNVKKKIELKISEKPLDKNNIIKKESLKKNADEIFLKLNVYNSDDSDMLSSDEDDDVKPIQITNNYSSMVQNLTVDVKNIEKEKIKNEKELLLELTNNKKKTLKSSNSWLSNVGEEMRRRKNEEDPQIKQLKFLTNNEESVNDEQDEYIDINDMEEEDLDDGEAEDEEEVEEEDEEEEVEEEDDEEEVEEEDDEEEVEEEDDEEEVEVEEDDEEEEELEVDEFVDADGIKYWVTDSKNGDVYEFLKDGDIGDEIGKLQNGVLFLS